MHMLILQLFLQRLRDAFEDNVRVKSRLMMKDAVKKTIGVRDVLRSTEGCWKLDAVKRTTDVLRSTAVLLLGALLRRRDRHWRY